MWAPARLHMVEGRKVVDNPRRNRYLISVERNKPFSSQEKERKGILHLKTLQLLGFKSFADKTKLEFTQGITAVVGPNGCGKSNIADAFRWVFGEQSAKSMRSSKMLDVIFSGTSKRKPLNLAEVTITLTNASQTLATEYEEIAVTRRLHRSGDSEYFLNGKLVRLKDIQGLFLDSGIGRISFFEQGKIDQIIQSTPLERRGVFEEAAGILRFLQRRQEALRQLEQMSTNLERVEEGHREVQKQIVILEAQAEKALAFKQLKMALQQLEKGIFLAKVQKTRKKHSEAKAKEEEAMAALEAASSGLKALQAQEHESKWVLEQLEKAFYLQSEQLFALKGEREVKRGEKRDSEARLKESTEKEVRWNRELEELLAQALLRERELAELKQKQTVEQTDFTALEEACILQKKNVELAESDVTALRQRQQQLQRQKVIVLQNEAQVSTQMGHNQIRLEGTQEKFQHLQVRKEKLRLMEQECIELAKEKEAVVKTLKAQIEERREVFYSVEERCEGLSKDLKRAGELIDEGKSHLAERQARYKALMRLKQDMEGFSAGSKRLLALAADSAGPLYGKIHRLCECFVADTGFEKALAAALLPYSQTLVLETFEDLMQVLLFAKKEGLTDFSLFARDSISDKTPHVAEQGMDAFCSHVAETPLSRHFLSELSLAAEKGMEVDFLQQQKRSELLFEEGSFIDHRCVYFQLSSGGTNLFLREAELLSLEEGIAQLELLKKERESAFKKVEQNRVEMNAEMMALDKAIRRMEMSLVEGNFGFQRLNSDREKYRKEQVDLEKELKILVAGIEEQKNLAIAFQEQHMEAKHKLSEAASSLEALEEQLQRQTEALKRERLCQAEQEAIFQRAMQGMHQKENAIHMIEAKNSGSQRQQARLQEELVLSQKFHTEIAAKLALVVKALESIELQLDASQKAWELGERAVVLKKQEITQFQTKVLAAQERVNHAEAQQQMLASQIEQLDSSFKALKTEVKDRYALELEEAEAQFPAIEGSIEQAEKKARNLRQTIESAGDINMTSIEECEKSKLRHQFLAQQLADLTGSKAQIMDIISQLERESRKLFKETFDLIAFNFRKNFAILFNGGEADLQFIGGENILEGGIDIIACPPGKQMRSISLLSGGEKCLTAMALLFAIFEVKVTPFCILDEIDAPLDDSNVERFANVVRQFTDRCQFIIITHNKRTMAIADLLCGVSMEEKGVSKLLQMEFVSDVAFTAKVMAE